MLALRRLPIDVSAPANPGTIDDLGLGMLIRKLKAFSVVVRSALIPVDFALIWWSVVGHWDVALSMDVRSDGRHVFHVGVRVGVTVLRLIKWPRHRIILGLSRVIRVTIGYCLDVRPFVHLTQSPVKSVLAVSCNVAMDFCPVNVRTFEALRDVLTIATIVERVDFFFLAPPAGIDYRIYAC